MAFKHSPHFDIAHNLKCSNGHVKTPRRLASTRSTPLSSTTKWFGHSRRNPLCLAFIETARPNSLVVRVSYSILPNRGWFRHTRRNPLQPASLPISRNIFAGQICFLDAFIVMIWSGFKAILVTCVHRPSGTKHIHLYVFTARSSLMVSLCRSSSIT